MLAYRAQKQIDAVSTTLAAVAEGRLDRRVPLLKGNADLNHIGSQINATLAPGVITQQGMRALEGVFAQTMPRDMGFDYSGMSFQEQVAAQGVPASVVFGLSLLVVFLLLAAMYESWALPFGVLLGTPIAVLGALGALWLRRFELDVFSQIGLIMVIGLAAKNAILIVEFAKVAYERGMSLVDAALEGVRVRRRALFMTSFAFILGCVPLWTAVGAGAVGGGSSAPS